jgi:hypothetical protein
VREGGRKGSKEGGTEGRAPRTFVASIASIASGVGLSLVHIAAVVAGKLRRAAVSRCQGWLLLQMVHECAGDVVPNVRSVGIFQYKIISQYGMYQGKMFRQ